MKTRKYNYWKVIQQRYTNYWEDVSQHEANSKGEVIDRKLLLHDLREYRQMRYPTRVVFRRERL